MPKNPSANGDKSAIANFAFHAASLVVSAAAIFYLGYHFVSSFSNEIETEYALQSTESDVISLDAYIIRNESVIYSGSEGSRSYLFSDGDKVSTGADIANIYGGSEDSSDSELVAIDKRLELLAASSITEGISSSDASAIDTRISDTYYTIRKNTELGHYSTLPKRRDELLTLINKRQIITGSVESFEPIIENLTARRETITEQHGSVSETVKSPSSGYFYSELDGYEGVFTPSVVSAINYDTFDRMTKSDPTEYSSLAIGKLATDFDWYATAECTRESLRFFNTGKTYTISFPYNNDETMKMELVNLYSEVGSERVILVFRSRSVPEDFSFRRMQPIEVIRDSYTGYKIPISATRLVDGETGVYILVGNRVEFRKIDILLEMEGYYIVAPKDPVNDPDYAEKLGLYDRVITGGKGLYVGKMIS